HRARRAARPAAAQTWARRAQHGATSPTPHRGGAVMLAADRGTLDAHTARYSLAARGGGSCPTDEGMRTFPRTAPGEDIIADRLGGQNRWPLTARAGGLLHAPVWRPFALTPRYVMFIALPALRSPYRRRFERGPDP